MDETTLKEARRAIAGVVAVGQFAREDWIDDPAAIEAGYGVHSYDDQIINDTPLTPIFMEGSDWRPAFRADQAWRELGSRMPVTVDYRPGADGRDALTVTMTVGARVGHPTTLTLGVNAEHGVFADPVTIEALGGRSASAAPGDDTLDPRTDVPRNVSNMASTGIEDDEIDRAWEALNEIARSHPAAVLWHEEMGGSRDLPRHAEPDRRVAARPRGDIATPAQSPVAAAGAAARAAGQTAHHEHARG